MENQYCVPRFPDSHCVPRFPIGEGHENRWTITVYVSMFRPRRAPATPTAVWVCHPPNRIESAPFLPTAIS
jgi:hypothetical protein